MQSNPIQQRIELICEKWEESKKHQNARIIRIHCQPDETDMVDTFYTYMIGADSPVMDIAFHFDSACADEKQFSAALLKELEEIIYIWNNSRKDERINYVPIKWKPDFMLRHKKNTAALFVENFNRLAGEMDLKQGLFAVAILKCAVNKPLLNWLENAIKAGIDSRVKFLISDPVSAPTFRSLAKKFPIIIATVPVDLNMPKAMEQAAAMGDPKDPATSYRPIFMKMMNAMAAKSEVDAERYAMECIDIATKNLSKDPYWITQIVVLYIAIGNDKIRYKKKTETLAYANKAVDTATAAQEYFENQIAAGLLAQTLMFRATVFFVQKNWNEAYSDFNLAFIIFKNQGNMPLAVEASRMAGKSAFKTGYRNNAIKVLADGARLGALMDSDTARGSSYAGLLELLLPMPHDPYILYSEIEQMAEVIYGNNWKKLVYGWKKVPDEQLLKQGVLDSEAQ